MKVISSLNWFELIAIGSFLLMVVLWNLAPVVVKLRMKKAGLNRPELFYRRNIRFNYKQKQKSFRKSLKRELKQWTTDDGAEIFIPLATLVFFGIIFFSFIIPKVLLSIAVLSYCIRRLVYICKHLLPKYVPAYTVFKGDEIGVLIGGSLLSPEELKRKLNEKMVKPESAVELSKLQPIAVKVIAHKEAILNARAILGEQSLDKNQRDELERKLETVVGLLKRRNRELSESGDVWLHMTGKQLHTGFNSFAESEIQEELDRLNVFNNATTITEENKNPVNPAIDDLLLIANDTKIDQPTRTLAKETIKEIERKLLGEELKNEQVTTQMSAMASIITARNMYDLNEPKTPIE